MLGLLLVDPQNDFFPGGALAVPDGDDILGPVNDLLAQYAGAPVFVSRDWHPPDTRHFIARGGRWPPHCVAGTPGAAFHEDLELPGDARVFSKGTDPEDDAGYSAFEGAHVRTQEPLGEAILSAGVDTLFIAGLATDYCVKATALDAVDAGFATFLFLPGVRAVNVEAGDGARAERAMANAGVHLVTS